MNPTDRMHRIIRNVLLFRAARAMRISVHVWRACAGWHRGFRPLCRARLSRIQIEPCGLRPCLPHEDPIGFRKWWPPYLHPRRAQPNRFPEAPLALEAFPTTSKALQNHRLSRTLNPIGMDSNLTRPPKHPLPTPPLQTTE